MALMAALSILSASAQYSPDTIVAQEPESLVVVDTLAETPRRSSTLWIKQLVNNGFHINDPEVDYPRFPRFLVNVYNWGDKTFNSYDPEYVVSTGKNWKLQAKNYNWMQTYAFIFPGRRFLHVNSDLYGDMGGYLSFMAVTIGYSFNTSELFATSSNNRTRFNLNFTCALFTADFTRTSTLGGAKITRFLDYDDGRHISVPLEDIRNRTTTATAYYFFNHRKYSHAAAYCFSKYQLKSAGTWIAGFSYNNQDVEMSFAHLPHDLVSSLPEGMPTDYRFHYIDYVALGGYAYSWVLKPKKWLINATGLIGAGYKQTKEDSSDGRRDMIASQGLFKVSTLYNHRALFVNFDLSGLGLFYFNGKYTFFNAYIAFQGTVGMRF